MTKVYCMFTAGALALAMIGSASAADEQTGGQRPSAQQSGQPSAQSGPTEQSGQGGQSSDQAYRAALKKCESMAAADRQKCQDAAKRKHGQM